MPRPFHVLIPGVAPRLQAWEDIQSRLHHEAAVKPRPTVTLSRSFGCEGFPIAERVKVELEKLSGEPWNLYDKTLLEEVQKEEGVSLRVMQNLGLTASRLERLGLAPSRVHAIFPELGNVGPASIPLVLSQAAELGRLRKGHRVALMGIGSGLNCAMAEVVW